MNSNIDAHATPMPPPAPVKRGRNAFFIPMGCLNTPAPVRTEFLMTTPGAGETIPDEFNMRAVKWPQGAMKVVQLGTNTMKDINVNTFCVTVRHENNLALCPRRRYGLRIDRLGAALAFVESIKRGGGSENDGGSLVSTVEVQLLANQADPVTTEAVYNFNVLVEFEYIPTGGSFPKLVKTDLLLSINRVKDMFLKFVSTKTANRAEPKGVHETKLEKYNKKLEKYKTTKEYAAFQQKQLSAAKKTDEDKAEVDELYAENKADLKKLDPAVQEPSKAAKRSRSPKSKSKGKKKSRN